MAYYCSAAYTNASLKSGVGDVAVSESRVHTGDNASIDVNERVDMRDAQDASIHERDAEIEDIGMRVKVIGGRVDRLGAFQGDPLTGLEVDAARIQPRSMRGYPGLDGSDLVQLMDPILPLAEIMRVARVRPYIPCSLKPKS